MKKVAFLLVALFVCFTQVFAETTSHGPKPKGYNYSQNRRNNNRQYKQSMIHFNKTKGHICSGDRYKTRMK